MNPRARSGRPLKVALVEDSRTQRALLRRVLEADGDIEVVGEATDAEGAVELVRASRPDVVTLDLQISGGGLETIGSLLRVRPTPILVLSVAVEGVWSTRAVDALAAGAADVLPKPVRWDDKAKATVRDRVRAIAGVRLHPGAVVPPPRAAAPGPDANPDRVVAMAASTGGPPALAHVLSGLAGIPAPVLVVQHLHSDFMAGFVAWLDRLSPIPVKAARQGERLKAGTVYVAPGEQHLRLGARRIAMLDAQPERIHRPSADELFASVASVAGADAVGVLLTGMGADGAVGLAEIRKAGGLAVVQDEATSAVFGMPQAAIKAGAADKVLPLDRIAEAVMAAVTRPRRARGARRAR